MTTKAREAPSVDLRDYIPGVPTPTVDCLYTTVQNISGAEAIFSFLPPHGRRMAANEQLTVAGNLIDRLAVKGSNRQFKALERALANGYLTIISTPSVIVYDEYTHVGMAVDNVGATTLGMVDPCWKAMVPYP